MSFSSSDSAGDGGFHRVPRGDGAPSSPAPTRWAVMDPRVEAAGVQERVSQDSSSCRLALGRRS